MKKIGVIGIVFVSLLLSILISGCQKNTEVENAQEIVQENTTDESDVKESENENGQEADADGTGETDAKYIMNYVDILADYKTIPKEDGYFGYSFMDLNNDNIPELFVGEISQTDEGKCYGMWGEAIYTLQDEKPVKLIESSDYTPFHFTQDNCILHYSIMGNNKYYYYVKKLGENEFKNVLILYDEYTEDGEEHMYIATCDENGQMDDDKELTEAEWTQEFRKYADISIELTPFLTLTEDDIRCINGELLNAYVWVDCPGWDYYIKDESIVPKKQTLHLTQLSATPNDIIDTDNWFYNNGLNMDLYDSFYYMGYGDIKYELESYNADGYELKGETEDDTYIYRFFGSEGDASSRFVLSLYKKDTLSYVKTFNFFDLRIYPDYVVEDAYFVEEALNWAYSENGILYVSMGHNTYASSASGNAYMMAIDIETGEILWKSKPLVANANNFEIIGDFIVCGYGFTDEPDYLYILDKATGAIDEKIKLKTGPDYIIRKNDILYVRTYDMDYTFQITED